MFDRAPASYQSSFEVFMRSRRLYLRYLALPKWLKNTPLSTRKPYKIGQRYILRWDTMPVYMKPTLWNRWGPGAVANLLLGVPRPGDEGMCPEGLEI